MDNTFLLQEKKYSIKEASQALGLCQQSVYNLIHAGELDAYIFKNKYVVAESDLVTYIEENKYRPHNPANKHLHCNPRKKLTRQFKKYEHLKI